MPWNRRYVEWACCLALGAWGGSLLTQPSGTQVEVLRLKEDSSNLSLSRNSNRATPQATKPTKVSDLYTEALPDAAAIEAYLESYDRNAHALMAAGLATRNNDLLREAALLSPDDPHLQLIAIGKDLFPDQHGTWVRRFKESQPDNALASQLLANQLFEEGDVEGALSELQASLLQTEYEDFATESILAREEAWNYSGVSEAEANIRSVTDEALYRPLSHTLADLSKGLLKEAPTEETRRLVTSLARQLEKVSDEGFPIDRLVAIEIEHHLLDSLNPEQASPYEDFTAGEAKAQLEDESGAFVKGLIASEHPLQDMDLEDPRILHYFKLTKHVGFEKAQAWLLSQTEQLDSP